MRFALVLAALALVSPAKAQSDQLGTKLMAAASVTLAAVANVGGDLEVASPTSASLTPYGLKAWMVNDCIYSLRSSTSEEGRRYQIDFRNLTGRYEYHGSSLIFLGTGAKPAICVFDGNQSSGCAFNVVVRKPYAPDALINDVLFVQQNGCAVSVKDPPGNRDPY